jgi:hypothetical protein
MAGFYPLLQIGIAQTSANQHSFLAQQRDDGLC